MKIESIKKPIWGIDQYLHYIILGLSIFNLIKELPTYGNESFLNSSASVFLSIIGVIAFVFTLKGKKIGNYLMIIWTLPQIIIFISSPEIHFDLTQGISFPIFSFEQTGLNRQYFGINIVPIIIFGALIFKIKNSNLYGTFNFSAKKGDKILEFQSKIKQHFTFGKEKLMLVLDHQAGNFFHVVQIDISKKSRFPERGINYQLCTLNKSQADEKVLKAYDFAMVGEVMITLENT